MFDLTAVFTSPDGATHEAPLAVQCQTLQQLVQAVGKAFQQDVKASS